VAVTASTPVSTVENLPLKQRPFDVVFIVFFSLFVITCIISDAIPTLGIPQTATTTNLFAQWNYTYSHAWDPLYQNPPVWLRFSTGLSAFVYGPFYLFLLIPSLIKGWNWIQLPAVIYATMIVTVTGIIIFGAEFFGEVRTPNPGVFLIYNGPYVLIPLLLLIRMRKPLPFTRKF
jgi:hypothetical protein